MDYNISSIYNFFGNKMTFCADREAIYEYDTHRHFTYRDIRRRSSHVASYLVRKLGLKKDDRVGLCAQNRIEFFDFFFAAYKTGIILTTYNGSLTERELFLLAENEAPSVLLCSGIYYEKWQHICEKLTNQPLLVNLDESGPNGYEKWLAEPIDLPDFLPSAEDILMLIHTGGTTGVPKAAKLSYRAITNNSISTVLTHNLTPNDATYLMLPLFHTAAWNSVSLGILLAGGRLVLKRKFDVETTYDIIESIRPSFLLGVPTIYQALAQSPRFQTTDFSSLKALRCGTAPLPRSLFQLYDAHNLPLCNAYGLTECGPSNFSFAMHLVTQDILRAKVGSVGQPMYYNRVRIVDDSGNEVPPGQPGELQFSGPLVFSGYWNNPEETQKVICGNWVNTGDIATCDSDGFYFIIGRKKNMFITGGENIFPIEIEDVLIQHPSVQDCCVIGVEDCHWGEVGKAFVQLRSGCEETPESIINYLAEYLPTIKQPKYISFVDNIPRNSVGKLLLSKVRALHDEEMRQNPAPKKIVPTKKSGTYFS